MTEAEFIEKLVTDYVDNVTCYGWKKRARIL